MLSTDNFKRCYRDKKPLITTINLRKVSQMSNHLNLNNYTVVHVKLILTYIKLKFVFFIYIQFLIICGY